MNIAYIYKLTNKKGLIYIGSHLVKPGKNIYSDFYSGSSQDLRINKEIVCKEILCYLKSEDRSLLFNYIQQIEHSLILDLDAINCKDYANATSMGVIGLNYKRLGAQASNIKQKKSKNYSKVRSRVGKKGAEASAYLRTPEWHSKGGRAAGRKLRSHWTKELYLEVAKASINYPDKKGYALWTKLGRPTKSYKTIHHILECVIEGLSFEEACSG